MACGGSQYKGIILCGLKRNRHGCPQIPPPENHGNPWQLTGSFSRYLFQRQYRNNRILIRDTAGNWTATGASGTAAGQFRSPCGVAVDSSDNLYVSECGNNRLQIRDKNGTWTIYGGGATGSTAGREDGQFNFPQGLVVTTNGMLLVADSNNNRIEAARFTGALDALAAINLLLLLPE